VLDVDLAGGTEPYVPAAVDDPLPRALEAARDEVRDVALARPAEVEPQSRGTHDRPRDFVDPDLAPAGCGVGTSLAIGPRRAKRRGRPLVRLPIARGLERVEEAGVDEPAAELRRPQPGLHGRAQEWRRRDDRSRVGVEVTQLGAGQEAR
jgi:hypothetical protein